MQLCWEPICNSSSSCSRCQHLAQLPYHSLCCAGRGNIYLHKKHYIQSSQPMPQNPPLHDISLTSIPVTSIPVGAD